MLLDSQVPRPPAAVLPGDPRWRRRIATILCNRELCTVPARGKPSCFFPEEAPDDLFLVRPRHVKLEPWVRTRAAMHDLMDVSAMAAAVDVACVPPRLLTSIGRHSPRRRYSRTVLRLPPSSLIWTCFVLKGGGFSCRLAQPSRDRPPRSG